MMSSYGDNGYGICRIHYRRIIIRMTMTWYSFIMIMFFPILLPVFVFIFINEIDIFFNLWNNASQKKMMTDKLLRNIIIYY